MDTDLEVWTRLVRREDYDSISISMYLVLLPVAWFGRDNGLRAYVCKPMAHP